LPAGAVSPAPKKISVPPPQAKEPETVKPKKAPPKRRRKKSDRVSKWKEANADHVREYQKFLMRRRRAEEKKAKQN
jgi:hypothetical protein